MGSRLFLDGVTTWDRHSDMRAPDSLTKASFLVGHQNGVVIGPSLYDQYADAY